MSDLPRQVIAFPVPKRKSEDSKARVDWMTKSTVSYFANVDRQQEIDDARREEEKRVLGELELAMRKVYAVFEAEVAERHIPYVQSLAKLRK